MKAEGPVVETDMTLRADSIALIRVILSCCLPSALPENVALLVSTPMNSELLALSRII